MGWTRGHVIGRGSSATVSIATTFTGEILAVKSCELTSSTCSSLQKEQKILSQLSSRYIIEYMGCEITCENNKTLYNVLMEYMAGGSLTDFAKKQSFGGSGGLMNESLVRVYAYQILKGLEYLHSNGIVHCDIKGQNILIGKNNVKIADLGCAKMVEKDGIKATNTIISGTPLFMAPEVSRGEEQGFPADIWSLGCTILEIATCGGPFWPDFTDPVSALYRIGYSNDVPSIPGFLSDNARDFLENCLKRDAKERWTAEELLLHHPFLNGLVEISPEDEKVVQISPTSILDQVFWVSMETPESSSSSSSSSSCSCENRIKKLSLVADSMMPVWEEDETWLTIRGGSMVLQQIFDVKEELMDGDGSEIQVGIVASDSDSESFLEDSFYFNDEEDSELVIVDDDLWFSQFVDDDISPLTISDNLEIDFVSTINDLEGYVIRSDLLVELMLSISLL